MSFRVTRSSTRNQVEQQPQQAALAQQQPPAIPPSKPPPSRKRKAPARQAELDQSDSPEGPRARRPKHSKARESELVPQPPAVQPRRKKTKAAPAMSNAGPSAGLAEGKPNSPTPAANSSRRKSSRITKPSTDQSATTSTLLTRRRRRENARANEDVVMRDAEQGQEKGDTQEDAEDSEASDTAGPIQDHAEDEIDEDAFTSSFLRAGAGGGLSSTLRALSGMMSSMSSRLRGILENLKQKQDPSTQLIALQELSEILLVSTEDNLAGHFSPDQYLRELIDLMQPNEIGEENPEMMLLACRCIANLMEALPSSTAAVVHSGAVPILCQKLLEIHFIDLAEQALSTLEKISVEFPASIVREGGLTACLTYLDFFATSTQRTAVTTAANCCRNIPVDSYPVVRDVMPILLNVLNSSDQKVVEQGCLCVSRVVESFKYHESKLEELVSADLLRATLRLLLPGTTNLIGPYIHTQFLRVLAIVARASPRLSAELFKMDVVDTLYQILTGVSPPGGSEDVASKIDSVVIMQALIHRPREQIFETLNVICELLPNVSEEISSYLDDFFDGSYPSDRLTSMSSRSRGSSSSRKRLEFLQDCKEQVKRFTLIMLPTLSDAYSSTVNLSVRQKVLMAQLKMLSNVDTEILAEALRIVPYSSFLTSVLYQEDHPTLVIFALQAAELLIKRLESIYRYQFYREGVISEIARLADRSLIRPEIEGHVLKPPSDFSKIDPSVAEIRSPTDDIDLEHELELLDHQEQDGNSEDDGEDDVQEHEDDLDDVSESVRSSSVSEPNCPIAAVLPDIQDVITLRARQFIENHAKDHNSEVSQRAAKVLENLKKLAQELRACCLDGNKGDTRALFGQLARHFNGDALESITSYEMLTSDIVNIMLDIFTKAGDRSNRHSRSAFLEAFMGSGTDQALKPASTSSAATPFSIMVHKLQDLLSRSEHFEVTTVHHNTFDSNRSSAASMLAKQIRLKLVADEDSGIPKPYRNIMVSIHAIATFKALDDYLRPRISLSERPRSIKYRDGISGAMAAYAAALTGRVDKPTVPSPAAASTASTSGGEPRRLTRARSSKTGQSGQLVSSATQEKPTGSRRSSRKHQQSDPAPNRSSSTKPRSPASLQLPETTSHPLECADENQLSDEDEFDATSALDAIVGDLEDNMEEEAPDPSAVNLEVAATGRITAKKEDGTRVATPTQSTTSSQQSSASGRAFTLPNGASALSLLDRPLSYAAALQAVPQDWHIEFSNADQPITNETTIYRAVHLRDMPPAEYATRPAVWSATHTINFRRVSGPPVTESSSLSSAPEVLADASLGMPLSLSKSPVTSSILQLLSLLHEVNANVDDVLSEKRDVLKFKAEPSAQFLNPKLTAKLNRQLEEPLIVASNCLPRWSEDLARLYPFLFPFETRHLFLQSTSFGYSRSMSRWQNAQSTSNSRNDRHRDERPFLGRLQRQKVRISRNRILESAVKVMELYGASPSQLEVEYFDEVGTGLGPTLEFYSTVSKEFSKKKMKLWRENESDPADEYAFGKRGLFPAPLSEEQANTDNGKRVLHLFKMLGKFVARSMLDSRIIDVSFNPTFFRIDDSAAAVTPSLGAVKSVDEDLAKSLRLLKQFAQTKNDIAEDCKPSPAQRLTAISSIKVDGVHVEDLGLDFTLPGYPNIELIEDGSNVAVTIHNVGSYIDRVIGFTLGSGVRKQVAAFRTGFSQVFPYLALKAFTPNELVLLFGRAEEDWSIETLMDSIKADHGFNMDSRSVRNLLQTMSELSPSGRRDFLQFVTGSPKLPIGGFKSLTPMFTVVCKPSEPPYASDDYLPSVMTCVNYLKLPDYSSVQTLRDRLGVAVREGQGAFHLS